jgi:hypothetical protein
LHAPPPTHKKQDRTVRLWDLRTPICQAVLQTPGHPVASFDQQGLVFAVGADCGVVKLYDAAQFARGPFETFVVGWSRLRLVGFGLARAGLSYLRHTVLKQTSKHTPHTPKHTKRQTPTNTQIPELRNAAVPIRQLIFSNDGNKLIAAAENVVYVMDAFKGAVEHTIRTGAPERSQVGGWVAGLRFGGRGGGRRVVLCVLVWLLWLCAGWRTLLPSPTHPPPNHPPTQLMNQSTIHPLL